MATSSPSFGFASSKVDSTFRCSLDGASAPCASPKSYSNLGQGSHLFTVAAIDRAGNIDRTPETRSFSVDTVAPQTTIASGPSGTLIAPSASIYFTASASPVGFQCRLDSGGWVACQSPKTYTWLSPGPHTFSVRAVDAVANADPSPATAAWALTAGAGASCLLTSITSLTWPAGCWRPYDNDASPFNRPLPPSPRLASDSAAIVSRLASWGKPQGLIVGHPETNRSDYGHPVYYASAEDPLYTIRCTMWTASCPIDGLAVRIPAAARPASGGDAHMVVIDQTNGWEYDFWQVQTQPLPLGGGTIKISHGGRTRWGTSGASGLGSNATAAHFGLSAGMIRAEEWETAVASGTAINHALFMSVKCSGGYSVYPAAPGTTAAPCSSFGSSNEGAPPMGAHFYLDMSDAQIDVLAVPAWRKPILKAMARYGLFVGDTFANGPNSFGLAAESDTQYRALGRSGRYAALGKKWGVGTYGGAYLFDIDSGVDWGRYLRVVDPCVSQRNC